MQQTPNLCEFGLVTTMIKPSNTILGIGEIVVSDKPVPTNTVSSFGTVDLLLLLHN